MIASREVKGLEHSSVELTVTVPKDEAQKEYDDLITKYSKTLAVKGFRRGKVPAKVLVQKFGDTLLSEASANLMENSLKEVFEEIEQKPLPYAVPEVKGEANLELGKDFTYTVTYDTYPEIEIGTYKELEIEEPQVAIGKEDEQRELEAIRDQNAVVVPKEGGAVEKDDIVTVDYVELDEQGGERSASRRQDFVFTVGSGYNLYKFDDDIIGMNANEERRITKEFGDDFEYEELRGKKVDLKIKVTAIKRKQLPELDDELAQDVNDRYKTLEDLTNDVRKRLEEDLAYRLRQMKINSLLDSIAESSKIDLPKTMIDTELALSWENFVSQSRLDERRLLDVLQAQGRSREDLLREWTPQATKSIKTRLIIHKIAENEKLEATDEEVEKEIARQAELRGTTVEETRTQFEQNQTLDYLRHEVSDRKVFDFLIANAKVRAGANMSYLDVVAKKQ